MEEKSYELNIFKPCSIYSNGKLTNDFLRSHLTFIENLIDFIGSHVISIVELPWQLFAFTNFRKAINIFSSPCLVVLMFY